MPAPIPVDDLIESAVDRYLTLFDTYDHVTVAFSGGKDSTCIMETGAIAAARAGKILDVEFFDEEVIFPETVAYMERLRQRTDINVRWICVPIVEGNAWSREHPYWHPWAPEDEPLWVRPMPDEPVTEIIGYDPAEPEGRLSLEFLKHYVAKARLPRTSVDAIGRRAAESPARRSMAKRMGWLQPPDGRRYAATASPIIDWSNHDVWRVIIEKGWDWNRAYLRMYQAGVPMVGLRIGPLFGEEPSGNLHAMRKAMPAVWPLACRRVHGAADLARYANSALLGRGRMRADAKVTAEAIRTAFEELPATKRSNTAHSIRIQIKQALNFRTRIPGRNILKTALRGDTKADRLLQAQSTLLVRDSKKHGHYRMDLDRVSEVAIARRLQDEQKQKASDRQSRMASPLRRKRKRLQPKQSDRRKS